MASVTDVIDRYMRMKRQDKRQKKIGSQVVPSAIIRFVTKEVI